MKLISMTDFVLKNKNKYTNDFYKEVINYANFLKKPITKSMFVPCDENDNVLEEPLKEHYTDCNEEQNTKDWLYNLEKYQKNKEYVIFEGCEICENNKNIIKHGTYLINIKDFKIIEALIPYNLEINKTF